MGDLLLGIFLGYVVLPPARTAIARLSCILRGHTAAPPFHFKAPDVEIVVHHASYVCRRCGKEIDITGKAQAEALGIQSPFEV